MRDFTPDKVYGVVAQLVKVKDLGSATALEAAAGGRLYSVVVDTADTGEGHVGGVRRKGDGAGHGFD
jgi:structural maintenance of chromosome 2